MIRKSALLIALALAACGDSNEAGLSSSELASYDRAALEQLASDGKAEKAIQVIRAKEQLQMATTDDLLVLADIYITQMNGVAAQVAVEKARKSGAIDSQTALQMGAAYLLQGRFEEAKAELRNVKLSGHDGFEALMLQADIAVQEGDTALARKYYGFASNTEGENPRVDLGLALLELGEGNLDAAKTAAENAISKDSGSGLAHYVLGAIARMQSEPEVAIDHLHKALELEPRNIHALLELIAGYLDVGKAEDAERVLDSAIAVAPQYSLTQFYTAVILAQKGQLREAQEVLLRTGELVNVYPAATRLFGLLSFELENYSGASKYLQMALANNPDDRQVRMALAESYVRSGLPAKSLEVLEPLTKEELQDAEAQAAAGAANVALGRGGAAAEMYRKAITFAAAGEGTEAALDKNIEGGLIAAQAIAEYSAGNVDKAIELMSSLEGLGLISVDHLTSIANMQMERGMLDGALETADKLISMEDGKAVGYNIKSAVYYRTSKMAEAAAEATKAIDLVPGYQSALKNRAYANSALGNYQAAKTDLKLLAGQVSTDGQLLAKLGHTHLMLNEFSEARVALQQARRLLPTSAVVAANYAYALGQLQDYDEAITQAEAALALATDESMKAELKDTVTEYKNAKLKKEQKQANQ